MTHLAVGICASAHIFLGALSYTTGVHCKNAWGGRPGRGRFSASLVHDTLARVAPPSLAAKRRATTRTPSRTKWRRSARRPAAVAHPASIGRDQRAPCSVCGRRRSVSISSEPRYERMLRPDRQLLVRARMPASEIASSTVTEKVLPANGRRLGYESTLSRHRSNTRHSPWHHRSRMPLRRAASAAAPWRVKRPRWAAGCSLSPNGWMVTLCRALPSRCWRWHACAQRAASVANSRPEPNRTTST